MGIRGNYIKHQTIKTNLYMEKICKYKTWNWKKFISHKITYVVNNDK